MMLSVSRRSFFSYGAGNALPGVQVRCLVTRISPPMQPVTIAGLLTSGSKKARAANKAQQWAARVSAMLRNPIVAVSSVAVANVAVYGAWKTGFWCAASTNPRRSAFGLCSCVLLLNCN